MGFCMVFFFCWVIFLWLLNIVVFSIYVFGCWFVVWMLCFALCVKEIYICRFCYRFWVFWAVFVFLSI